MARHDTEDRLGPETEAARWCGVKRQTMSTWRRQHRGPPFIKVEGAVRYSGGGVACRAYRGCALMSGAHLDGTTDALLVQGEPAAGVATTQDAVDRWAKYPVFPVYVLPSQAGRSSQAVGWCEYCEEVHRHGAGDSHRCAHCGISDSGHQRFGYVLKTQGKCRTERDVIPAAPFAGHHRLRTAMRQAAHDLRRVMLRHLLGLKRVRDTVDRDIHGYRVSVFGQASYAICPPPTPRGGGTRRSKVRPYPGIGRGLSRLAADVYGVSHGIAVARMLQAVTLDDYDPQFLRELAALVEAFDVRCGRAADPIRSSHS